MGKAVATLATRKRESDEFKKLVFLTQLADCGLIVESCVAAGIHKATAYRWRERDEQFASAWDEAIDSGTELLEREAKRRAVEGSDTLLIFLLKARRPDTYRERASLEHTGKDGKDLPTPTTTVQAGVLVVPGVLQDAQAWTQLVQGAPKPQE